MLLAVGVGAATVTACGQAGVDAPAPQPTSAVTTTPASPTATAVDPAALAEQRAIGAYEAMWVAYDSAGRVPAADPDEERLAAHATGRALEVLVEGLASLRARGMLIDGRVELHPEVVELTPPEMPSEARIEDCGDSTAWLTVDVRTGEVTDEPRGRQLVIATVIDVGGGVWKVSDFAVRAVGSCG